MLDILFIWIILYIVLEHHKFDCYVPEIGPVNIMPLKFQGRKVSVLDNIPFRCKGLTLDTCSESQWNIVFCKLPEYSRHHQDFHGI